MKKRLAVGHRRAQHRLALLCGITLLAIAGCAAPTPLSELPENVSIAVYQSRLDASERKFEIAVTNSSDTDIEITRLHFRSPAFEAPMPYERVPTTVAAGRTIDFRVLLAAPDCTSSSTTPSVDVEFTYGERNGSATVHPVDRFGQLPGITTQDCLASDTAHIAGLSFADENLRRATIAGRDAALLTLLIEPTGVSASITLHDIGDTVLLSLLDTDTGRTAETLPLDLTVTGTDQGSRVTIALVQSRCDQHSVADDKKGTHFPVALSAPNRSGTVIIQTSEKTRSELFNYLADVCNWG